MNVQAVMLASSSCAGEGPDMLVRPAAVEATIRRPSPGDFLNFSGAPYAAAPSKLSNDATINSTSC